MPHHRSFACLVLSLARAPLAASIGLCFLLAATVPALVAQSTAGSITGRIFNPATGEYVRNAEIRLQGTEQVAYSEEGGVY